MSRKYEKTVKGEGERKRRFCWTASADIILLQAVLKHRPWEFGRGVWNDIGEELELSSALDVTPRGCMLRAEHMCQAYKSQDMSSLRKDKSGTERQCMQRDRLLKEIQAYTDPDSLPFGHTTLVEDSNTSSVEDMNQSFVGDTNEPFVEDPMSIIQPQKLEKMISTPTTKVLPNPKQVMDTNVGNSIYYNRSLDKNFSTNIVGESSSSDRKRPGALDIDDYLSKKIILEEKELKMQEKEFAIYEANKLELGKMRIEMQERVALRRLELEFEDKEVERKWRAEQNQKEAELREKLEEREHQRQLELLKERQLADDRMIRLIELITKKNGNI